MAGGTCLVVALVLASTPLKPLLPMEEPPPQAVAAPTPTAVSLPREVVMTGQCLGFGGAQVVGALVVYALMLLPVVSVITGPFALAGACVGIPMMTAVTALVAGDYLSGDRHSLLYALIASFSSFWSIGAVALVLNAVLLGVAGYLSYSAVQQIRQVVPAIGLSPSGVVGPGRADQEQLEATMRATLVPVLAVLGAVLLVDVVVMAAMITVPAVVTTVVLNATREEAVPGNKLPRIVMETPEDRDSNGTVLAAVRY